MLRLLRATIAAILSGFRSRRELVLENLALRQQLATVLQKRRPLIRPADRAFWVMLRSLWPRWSELVVIVKPETVIGWHRKGFKLFWRWKSQAGRPRLPENIRKLIVRMVRENPTWGQARVADELSLKLGIHVSPRTVRKYWPKQSGGAGRIRTSSQHWRTFVKNHAQGILACDFLVAVTVRFQVLFVFLVRPARAPAVP